ncbi:MOXD1 homolog 2-like [Neocloeon triangulifer]|uniref:MOXD1 homolog 2-like n=1 Tax=Neocloeon triangulifer TaxID=2078957 RepID=UPI00286F55E8|nr:MOXD1 homolog 2-like [Neocloeon triangulifer]
MILRQTGLMFVAALCVLLSGRGVSASEVDEWTHSAWLDDRYLVRWTPGADDVTFEVSVATLGYVGFGLSLDGRMQGSDVVIGWVQHGRTIFQDRHVSKGHVEPIVDASQDWELLRGMENDTHTVLTFRRAYDTCDRDQDIRITNDTMRMVWAYHSEDPVPGLPLAYHGPGQRGARSAFLVLRVDQSAPPKHEVLHTWELRNPSVLLPSTEESLYWCKIFKLPATMTEKSHIIRYEPLHQPGNRPYMHHAMVYECLDNPELDKLSRLPGAPCYQQSAPQAHSSCTNIALAWAYGSEGFTFPPEAGYPLEPTAGPRYFMLETHYTNPSMHAGVRDSSGIKIFYTTKLRPNDAGVLSVGMDPNWRHIIPPGQPAVVSEGHCIGTCTQRSLPRQGVQVFGVMLHTHLLGRRVRLRHIRGERELAPLASDSNYDAGYQEFRRLPNPTQVMPGDHLISECVYNSSARNAITLGGLTIREEMCLAVTLYWPRVNLSLCYSLPSLPTVLHSLGIHELYPGSNPVKIKSPTDIANMTLEHRLLSYDWKNNFHHFQEATHSGSFKPLCWHSANPTLLPGTEDHEYFFPNVSRLYREPNAASCRLRKKKLDEPLRVEVSNSIEQNSGLISETSSLNIGPSLRVRALGLLAAGLLCVLL